jgi:bacterial/archaeal transporter family protein
MGSWILPAALYVLLLAATGITSKLALRTVSWEQMVLWVPIAYAVFAAGLVATRGTRLPLGAGGGWAALTAVFAAAALGLFFLALSKGDASQVVPATSAYPALTLFGAAIFLSETITLPRILGTALVIGGVVLISR